MSSDGSSASAQTHHARRMQDSAAVTTTRCRTPPPHAPVPHMLPCFWRPFSGCGLNGMLFKEATDRLWTCRKRKQREPVSCLNLATSLFNPEENFFPHGRRVLLRFFNIFMHHLR